MPPFSFADPKVAIVSMESFGGRIQRVERRRLRSLKAGRSSREPGKELLTRGSGQEVLVPFFGAGNLALAILCEVFAAEGSAD